MAMIVPRLRLVIVVFANITIKSLFKIHVESVVEVGGLIGGRCGERMRGNGSVICSKLVSYRLDGICVHISARGDSYGSNKSVDRPVGPSAV